MSERKSRFGDPTTMPDDPALRVLSLRQPGASAAKPPRTWPGRLAEEDGQGLQNHLAKERAERSAERAAGLVLVKLDPESIGLTEFANRHALSLSSKDKKLKALKASIKTNGQDTPVKVRPAALGAAHLYELIEGHRRHAAIAELNRETDGGFQILARLDAQASEAKQLVLKMYRENAEREDLSAFETGRMFQSWLAAKLYPTQGALAEDISVSDSMVTRCLAIASFPGEVIQAFGDPRVISQRWADALSGLVKHDLSALCAAALEVAQLSPRLEAEAVFKRLMASSGVTPRKRGAATREEQFKVKGKIVWTFAHKRGFVAAKFPKSIDPEIEAEVAIEVKKAVDRVMTQRFGNPK